MSRHVLAGAVAAATLLGAACHHRPAAQAAATPPPPAAAPTAPSTPPAPAPPAARAAQPAPPLSEDEIFRRKSLADLNAERPLGDVFFEYDQDALPEEARTVLQRDAAWLSKWSQTRIVIEGHCDERGTAEYNLSLGDRRAAEVRTYLTTLGIPPERIQIRSLGKESPFCTDSGESCWSQNRRGHFLIVAK